jgi:excisionase family DNA binding protein
MEREQLEIKDDANYTDKEVAEILKVSPRTAQRLRLARKLPSVRVTSKIKRVRGKDLKKYLAAQAA